jgi:small nuclear ribonucleoprotein (snRNP)-like protein
MLFYSYFKTLVGKEVRARHRSQPSGLARALRRSPSRLPEPAPARLSSRRLARARLWPGGSTCSCGAAPLYARAGALARLLQRCRAPGSSSALMHTAQITVELKNDLAITGTLHSVDQYLNIKLNNTRVVNEQKYPHMVSLQPAACSPQPAACGRSPQPAARSQLHRVRQQQCIWPGPRELLQRG